LVLNAYYDALWLGTKKNDNHLLPCKVPSWKTLLPE
jgi:hypothetical protein